MRVTPGHCNGEEKERVEGGGEKSVLHSFHSAEKILPFYYVINTYVHSTIPLQNLNMPLQNVI